MSIRLKLRWWPVAVLGILVLIAPQVPGCAGTHAAKRGRVVDADTGRGVPNAYVVAVGQFDGQNPVHGSFHNVRYRLVTQTDAEGYYRVPSTLTKAMIGIPGTDARESWLIAVVSPGRVVAGTTIAFNEFGATSVFRGVFVDSAQWTLGGYLRVDDIQMIPDSFDLKTSLAYHSRILSTGRNKYLRPLSDEDKVLARTVYDYFLSAICGVRAEAVLDDEMAGAAWTMVADDLRFRDEMRRRAPAMWGKGASEQPTFAASDVCEAMRLAGGP